jgi:hypothetical protein
MSQPEQLLAVTPQLAGQLGGGDPSGEATEDPHQLGDGKVHGRLPSSRRGSSSITSRPTDPVKGLSTESPS